MKVVRLGAATAWSRDRFEPAGDFISADCVNYVCFDSMSEVTMGIAQSQRMDNSMAPGFDPYLLPRMKPILKEAKSKGIKLITNSGWLDPAEAARKVKQLGEELGIKGLKVAAVIGGNLIDQVDELGLTYLDDGAPVQNDLSNIVTVDVYMGAAGIVDALKAGADVVITSRVGDACLYLGPLAYEYGWDLNDPQLAAKGMILGHIVECGSQVTGGCFADPGYKEVPDLWDVGSPILEVYEDGTAFITKTPGKGGVISVATCKEQLLYEVQDPSRYLCPDVVADLTEVHFEQVDKERVQVFIGNAGKPRTPTLKVLVGLKEGYIAEEFVLFAGDGALARAEMTKDLMTRRFEKVGLKAQEVRWDYVGRNSVHREATPRLDPNPYEVVLRIAVKTLERVEAEKLGREVDPLAVCGTYGVGKWGTQSPGARVRAIVGLKSALVPREHVPYKVMMQ